MFRQTSTSNKRNKGFKVKHVLQIAVLLAVCIWLLYQMKHSHDKKKAYDDNVAKTEDSGSRDQVLNLGRKDLKDDTEDGTGDEKHSGEEGEGEESKQEEVDDDGRGGGDHEIEEHSQEKAEENPEHGNGFVEEERENGETREHEVKENEEEKESGERENEEEKKEDKIEDVGSSENHDHANGDGNSQEAHEEHYIADNAANGVTQDPQILRSEAGNGDSATPDEELRENSEKTNLENENTNTPDNIITTNITEKIIVESNGSSQNVNEEKVSEVSNQTEPHSNSTLENIETSGSFAQNETSASEFSHDQNVTSETELPNKDNIQNELLDQTEKMNGTLGAEESDKNSVPLTSDEHIEAVQTESTDSSNALELPNKDNIQNEFLDQTEKMNATLGAEESDKNSVPLTSDEHIEAVQTEITESTDSSNALVIPEEKEALTDLETLPQAESGEKNMEAHAAE